MIFSWILINKFDEIFPMDLTSNQPFWLIKNGLLQSFPSLKNHEQCDVLIIGGGITGSLIAHQCVEDGFKTILVDKREIANGSTSATTSMLQYEIDIQLHELSEMIGQKNAELAYQSCSEAIDKLDKLSKKIKSEAGFQRKESLYFASKKPHEKTLLKEFEARKNAHFKVKWLEPEEIQKKYGFKKTFGGILSKQGASIDAFQFAHELLSFNIKKGLKVFDKTEIKKVDNFKGFNKAKTSENYVIKAKKIIYCNGYESAELIKENFVKLKSTYAIVSEIDEENLEKFNHTLLWNTDDPYLYMRTTDDNRLLVGGGDVDFKDAEKRDSLLCKKRYEIEKTLKKFLPDYPFYADFAWAGTFGETKDGLPYIGTHPKFSNSYFVLGFGGNGITFSVAGMEMVSYFLKRKKHPLTDLFKFKR